MEIGKELKEEKEPQKEPTQNNPQEKTENIPQDNNQKKQELLDSEEYGLKDHYSIDEISYSKFENFDNEIDEENLLTHKKKKIYNLSIAILNDNLEEFQKILNSNESLISKKTLDGYTFIQCAALNGSLNCFKYLLSLKVKTNEDIEGFHLIHLSLMKSIFNKNKKKCKEMFDYIYQNLPEQKKLVDRLGRTYLHLIFELNFADVLDNMNIDIDDLFIEDYNGEYVLNYIYIYNAEDCFYKIIKDGNRLRNLYITARKKYKISKGSDICIEEKFLENIFIYRNERIIELLVINNQCIKEELYIDLKKIREKYFHLNNDEIKNENIQQYDIQTLLMSIECCINYLINGHHINFQNLQNKEIFKTAIVYNKSCINHIKLPDNNPIKHFKQLSKFFENSDRLSCLISEDNGIMLNEQIFNYSNETKKEPDIIIGQKYIIYETQRKSCLNDILKCHDIKYIKALKYKSDNILKNKNKKKDIQNFWDDVDLDLIEKNYFLYNYKETDTENTENKEENSNLYKYEKIDIDTFINQYSYENIFYSTGCILDAIDLIMTEGLAYNAFALIRPPGHHSGYYGPVENKFNTSNGFCIVNNIAIAAAYTKYRYNELIKKIAIVDIDVHHGNGTQEIVEMLNYKNFTKPFNYEKICGVKITEKQNINWLDFDDAKNVLFISTHIYDKNNPDKFYPYSGSDENNTKKDSDIYPGGIYNIPFEYKENYPYEYRNILRSKIIPRLYKFKPDIIFVSAGFDGHKLENINENHMLLQENDYGYIAQQLQFVANKFCKGRMIAVLEGGYNINTGVISSFAQSVFNFARFMNIGSNMLQCNDVKLSGHKRTMQFNEEMELYNKFYSPKIKPRRSERLKNMEEKNNENINLNKNEEIKDNNEKKEDNKDNKDNNINNKKDGTENINIDNINEKNDKKDGNQDNH